MEGKTFKEQRKELNLTQQDTAILLGVSRVTYIKWETQPELMPVGQYRKLIDEFERLRALREDADGLE